MKKRLFSVASLSIIAIFIIMFAWRAMSILNDGKKSPPADLTFTTKELSSVKTETGVREFLNISGGISSTHNEYVNFSLVLDYEIFENPNTQEYYEKKKPYTLELIGKDNLLIKSYPFGTSILRISTSKGDTQSDSGVFSLSVPFDSSIDTIVIKKGKDTLFEKNRSAHTPEVKIDSPRAKSKIVGLVDVDWKKSDKDDDSLLCRLESKNEKNTEWEVYFLPPISEELESLHKEISLDSGENLIRVACSDGFNTAYDYVNVTVNNPLKVRYTTPLDKQKDAPIVNYLQITFNNNLKPESIHENSLRILENGSILYKHGGCISESPMQNGIRCYIGHNESNPLKKNTNYTVILTPEIEDIFGNKLEGGYEFTFTTE